MFSSARKRRTFPTAASPRSSSFTPAPQLARAGAFHHDFTRVPVSAPDDRREREADRISREVMHTDVSFDLRNVRIHTDARAAASARALGAKAYTAGNDIFFGAGRFAPHHPEGRRLLAHELVHVMQPADRIYRAPLNESRMPEEDVHTELARLLDDITTFTTYTTDLSAQLKADPGNTTISETLTDARKTLVEKLEERIALLRPTIADLTAQTAGMASTTEGDDALGLKLQRYEAELPEHEKQLRPLKRWKTRQDIAEIDTELATLPIASDPDNPAADLQAARREELLEKKKALGRSLTSSAHEYEQFDKRWAKKPYGAAAKGCSQVKEGGCGPTSLAIVLNFLYAEDPESVRPGPIEFVTPDETVTYAETHGRWCGHGTVGETMVTQVHTQWPGYRGKSIKVDEVAGQLRGGNLVIFLCKPCKGTTAGSKERTYKGHFMVLNGVDESGETFNVLDPGDNEKNDIVTMTKSDLAKSIGFWIIERK